MPLKSQSASLPAPIGGWNARDSLADMEITDAVSLLNWFPQTSYVQVRNGYTRYATGFPGQVETVMQYASATATKLFGIAGGNVYQATSPGAVGAPEVTGLSNSRFQYQNISTPGGSFMLMVNGVDKLRGYNGSTWYIDGDGSHDITGVDTATCIQINLFKNRLWLVQKDTLKVWYLGTNSIAGAANPLDFAAIAQKGGYLMAMGTWTIDAGYGVDDLAVFITSQGEVIVYKGTDPTSASTWALVGVWQMGAPLGRRCFTKYAGDILLVCQDGVVPLSGALQSSRVNPRVALTDKIQFAMSNAATIYGPHFGWQLLYYPKGNILFLNVPVDEGNNQQQYAMNSITKSWGQFQGWNANCWEIYRDDPYFGGNTYIGKAWEGTSDNNTNITTIGKQAFSYFGSPGKLKRWVLMRPILFSNGNPAVLANINVDFSDDNVPSSLTFSGGTQALWDVALWDSGSWGSDLTALKNWQGVNGVGFCAAVRLQTAGMGIIVQWVSTDIVFEEGDIL